MSVLLDTEATYYVTLERKYPSIFFFGYVFYIDLPTPVNVEVLSNTLAKFSHTFTRVPAKSYQMNVQVYIYFFQQKAWKVAEKTVTISVTDSLSDFFQISGKQANLKPFTPSNTFVPDAEVDFAASLKVPSSVLSSNLTVLSYDWTLTGPNTTVHSSLSGPVAPFVHNFTAPGQYVLSVDISANISSSSSGTQTLVKKGTVKENVYVKQPISKAQLIGNNLVKNGSLLHLNVTCTGSSNFMICYFFSEVNSSASCFTSGSPIVVDACFQEVSHYFPNNGTQYINVGIRNDVSETTLHSKITIYKVGPTRSLVFVILPLVSSFLVIIIILSGIAHHIRQRRRLNATVEVATMESFGLYGQDSLTEKTFFERIHQSLKGIFRRRTPDPE